MTRIAELRAFLKTSEWAEAFLEPLAGDASNRRYERLSLPGGARAVLMDAPPEKGEDVRPFVAIAEFLTSIGLSAPRVLARDETKGFLILEDLGDDLFARVVAAKPEMELPLYEAATDALLALHAARAPSELKTYDAPYMAEMAALSFRWYLDRGSQMESQAAAQFRAGFEGLLAQEIIDNSVLIQRDYHAENLLWLPERSGPARVGLLDFQDAMLGHPAYDLVSLLQDARRDVPEAVEEAMIERYCDARDLNKNSFQTAYALLGAQRNLRILGVFARLSLNAGKAHYIDFIPRVWGYLMRDLEHPVLADIRAPLFENIPAPTPQNLAELKEQCGTVPTL